ncbi:MAG: flagellar biosynthesis anti-sigma factor FlgM [Cytophagales bacterium]|nr:flagellar biosynthesis anti-sigma factor FlgM [Rhizobacter sp.]
MKIGNPTDKPSGVGPVGPARTQPGETAKTQEAAAHTSDPSAKVELSNTAASLLSGGANSEFDADKVARIAQAISDGKFEINAEKIADRLIANAHEVLGKAQH